MRFAANLKQGEWNHGRRTHHRSPVADRRDSTHTTVITDGERSGGGGGMFLIALLIIVALVVGVWAFNKWGGSEANKNNAIANAAQDAADGSTNLENLAISAGLTEVL